MPETTLAKHSLPVFLFSVTLSFVLAQGGSAAPSDPAPAAPAEEPAYSSAGYVDDRRCGTCHRPIYDSYQEVGMARSFFAPRPESRIEDFATGFFHESSDRHYQVEVDGDGLLFRRFQLDGDGTRINVFEQSIDWILGSGNHARTYVYQNELGELYQLPIAWYSQTANWGMAPGYDRADHSGVTRAIKRECMFCHNAYPETAEGADDRWQPQRFPKSLPQGTGCQRCHGPGAAHMDFAITGLPDEQVRAAIVNPGKLPADRRDDICFSCHLQPSAALPGIRRFGVGDHSFRPGQALDSYQVQFDIREADQLPSERFEINHHPYRLRQSKCFQTSEGKLGCLNCHDPHRRVPPEERAAHYRAACLECHQPEACRLDEMEAGSHLGVAKSDCVSCHMPKRRTQDVVQVVMTDHAIGTYPESSELLAPRQEREPELVGIDFLHQENAPRGVLGEIYRAAAVLRVGKTRAAEKHLAQAIKTEPPSELTPYLDLASAQLHLQLFDKASETLEEVLRRQPGHSLAWAWLALSKSNSAPPEEVLSIAKHAVELLPTRPESQFNLAHQLLRADRNGEAAKHLELATTLRPNMAVAWLYLGEAYNRLGRFEQATSAFQSALAVDPTLDRAYLALGEVLVEQKDRAGALRVWRHGVRAAKRPEELRAAIRELEAEP